MGDNLSSLKYTIIILLICVQTTAYYIGSGCDYLGLANSNSLGYITSINSEFIFKGFGSGRAEYRRLLSEHSSPWSFSLGGLCTHFFIKPKPKITDLPTEHRQCSPVESLVINGKEVNLYGCQATELYLNVVNEGKTTIKRMRARAKIHPLTNIMNRSPIWRPQGMKEEEWLNYKKRTEEMDKQIEDSVKQDLFGKSIPFSKTPKGTIAFQWIQADYRLTYEVDLTPKSDEASVKLVGIYPLNRIALSQVTNAGLGTNNYPMNYHIVIHIGNTQFIMGSGVVSKSTEPFFVGLVKFRIFAENTSDEVAEIFHIEIPASLDNIICTKVKRLSSDFRKFNKLFLNQ